MTPRALPPRDRGGFTTVELVAAILILTVGVLGLAATASVITTQTTHGAQATLATAIAQARLEELASRPCAAVTAGTASTGMIRETWTVTPLATNARTVTDTVTYVARAGQRKRLVFTSVIRCG